MFRSALQNVRCGSLSKNFKYEEKKAKIGQERPEHSSMLNGLTANSHPRAGWAANCRPAETWGGIREGVGFRLCLGDGRIRHGGGITVGTATQAAAVGAEKMDHSSLPL